MINFRKKQNSSGYAILELLFYISLFAVLSIVVIDAMIIMSKSFKETSIEGELLQSTMIMERMTREVRGATDISSLSSTDLLINTLDNAGAAKTVEFVLYGGNILLKENGTLTGNLNTPNITVTNLSFAQITTTEGKAVKMSVTVKSNNDTLGRTETFYDTIVLRGIY